jgi:hypothetical protein
MRAVNQALISKLGWHICNKTTQSISCPLASAITSTSSHIFPSGPSGLPPQTSFKPPPLSVSSPPISFLTSHSQSYLDMVVEPEICLNRNGIKIIKYNNKYFFILFIYYIFIIIYKSMVITI